MPLFCTHRNVALTVFSPEVDLSKRELNKCSMAGYLANFPQPAHHIHGHQVLP